MQHLIPGLHFGKQLAEIFIQISIFRVAVEYPLQAPGPGHGGVALGCCSFVLVGGCLLFILTALAPFGRHDGCSMFTVWREGDALTPAACCWCMGHSNTQVNSRQPATPASISG